MTKSRNYLIIGGICFVLMAIINARNFFVYLNYFGTLDILSRIVIFVSNIGFAISLFIKNKGLVTITSAVFALRSMCWCLRYCISYRSLISFYNFLSLLASIAIFITAVLSLKNNQIVKKIWFVGGALCFISRFVSWINYSDYSPISNLKSVIIDCIFIAGFIFIGLWLKEDDTFIERKPVKENIASGVESLNKVSSNSDTIEKLKLCKELLDSGVITQEEFDAKKKELLG